MISGSLKRFWVREASIHSEIDSTRKLDLAYSCSFHVHVRGEKALGVMAVTVATPDKKTLDIHVEANAGFNVEGAVTEAEKKELHDMCFNVMFPLTAKQVTTLGQMAGLNHLKVPKPDTSKQQIMVNQVATS